MTRIAHNLLSPLGGVSRDFDRVFSGIFDRDFGLHEVGDGRAAWLPAMDVSEQDDVYRIEAELPGFSLEDIDVTVEGRKVTVSGKKSLTTSASDEQPEADKETTEPTYHVRERRDGSFNRTVTLPVHVDPAKTAALLRDGVLTLELPKAEAVRQHKIEVQGS